jgi:peptide/nickel transport system permease protein
VHVLPMNWPPVPRKPQARPNAEGLVPSGESGRGSLSFSSDPAIEVPSSATQNELKTRHGQVVLSRLLPLLQRLGFGLIVLLAIVYLCFFGLEMARGGQFGASLRHGLTAGGRYVAGLLQGDLGMTLSASQGLRAVPVTDVLWPTVSKSLGLLGVSLAVAAVLGVPLGAWAARHRHGNASLITLVTSLAGMSLPSFFVALLAQMAVIKWVRSFGGTAPLPVGGFGWDTHLVLPALVLATRPLAQIARVTFISLSNVLDQDYVRTAHSKGLPGRSVWRHHVYRNAAIPILTTLLTSLRFSLSSLPIVERFFSWPGIGFNLLRSIARQDDNLTVILLLCLGTLFILANLLLEAAYRWIDPRVAEQQAIARTGTSSARAWLADFVQSVPDSVAGFLQGLRKWGRTLTGVAARGASLSRRTVPDTPDSAFRRLLQQRIAEGQYYEVSAADRRAERRRAWVQATVGNLAFSLGTVLLAVLLVVVLFGTQLAPQSPYVTQTVGFVDGTISSAPFPPSDVHPWGTDMIGRDIMSLVLVGARRTLSMAVFIVLARMAVGFVLGALAGWNAGSAFDRFVMGLSEVIAPFPALLLAMILILALGIREGVSSFVLAFCFVGWGEVMQYVRSEVITIRPQVYIEGARAVGLRTPRIIYSHVLPNLVSALIVLSALEMGAVLMLLAELGFLDIFIGGGTFAELMMWAPPYHYSDVPEWGAMLSNVRLGARSWPWTAIYPSLAFALAILAFNLFGEGLRRLIDRVGVGFTRVINRTTVVAAVVFVLGVNWAGRYIGPSVYFRQYAQEFDGEHAMLHVQVLSDPALEGRSPGSLGQEAAAEYIAAQYQAYGLQVGGETNTYFQTRPYDFTVLDSEPELLVHDGGARPQYREDFVEFRSGNSNLGETEGQVRWLGTGQLLQRGALFRETAALANLDTGDDLLLLLSDQSLSGEKGRYLAARGSLVVADEQAKLARRWLLGGVNIPEIWSPSYWISEDLANRILAGTGETVDSLREAERALGQDEIAMLETGVEVSTLATGTIHTLVPVRHVLGHLPGVKGKIESTYIPGAQMDNQLIMVMAQYDGVGAGPDGTLYPGANDNASGVAVMLEAIRTLQEQEYTPNRTLLFIAYAGEGTPRGLALGEQIRPAKFLEAKTGFSNYQIEAVIYLKGLGYGTEPRLELSAGGSQRLASLFEEAARNTGVRTRRAADRLDMNLVFEEGSAADSADEAPTIALSWVGWDDASHRASDTLDTISSERLEHAGETLSLALMVMGSEENY